MNNAEKFYKRSGEVIDVLEKNISGLKQNFSYATKRIVQKRDYKNPCNSQIDTTCFFQLVNMALVGLNREKIENAVETNWDSYVPAEFVKGKHIKYDSSKIPFFRDFLGVFTCKDSMRDESSKFWVKKIRDSLMHGNFEINIHENDITLDKPKIKVVEKNKNGTNVFEMYVNSFGFNEFVEDNFTNVLKDNVGIVNEEYCMLGRVRKHIGTRQELEAFLKDDVIITRRGVKEGTKFDGMKIINTLTGENLGKMETVKNSQFGPTFSVVGKDYLDNNNLIPYSLESEALDVVIHVLEEKRIYDSSAQTELIRRTIAQYITNEPAIYLTLDTFKHIFEHIAWLGEKKHKKTDMALTNLHKYDVNIENSFAVLKLYRMLYACQNSSFSNIDSAALDLSRFEVFDDFATDFSDKVRKKMSTSNMSAIDAENVVKLQTIRDCLAHGNLQILNKIKNDKLITYFVFYDKWKNRKTGDDELFAIFAPVSAVNELTKQIDDQIIASINSKDGAKEQDRRLSGKTAPAKALFLKEVIY